MTILRKSERQETSAAEQGDLIDLNRAFRILLAGKWWVLGCIVVAVLLAVFYLLTTPYRYETDALIQIETNGESPLSGLAGNIGPSGFTGQQSSPAQSQIPIIKSRDVLGQTVRDLNMTIHASPSKTPIIGNLFGSNNSSVEVSRFDVPEMLRGLPFKLVFRDDTHYRLVGPSGQSILDGVVGQPSEGVASFGVVGEHNSHISIFIRSVNLGGRQSVTFDLVKQIWLKQVNSLASNLNVIEVNSGSGILSLSMTGTNRDFITSVVNSVAQNYVNQNVETRSQNAEQSLQFLNEQLPDLKADVDEAEAKLAAYQESNQPVDLSAEASTLLQRASNVEDKKSQLKVRIAELTQEYTNDYPAVQSAREQLQELNQQSQQIQQQINRLPSSQREMLGLQRDLRVNTELYTSLLNRAQELRVVKAGTIGNVRIIDKAVFPVSPVWPKRNLVLFLYIVAGFMIGFSFVIVRTIMRRGLMDAAQIESETGYAVYSVVPYSEWLKRARRRKERGDPEPILARDNPSDPVVEALRSLRTSLHFAQIESGSNVLLMTGPSPGVGKSFLSINLGHLLADAGQNVAIVDADMRRGRIHEFLPDRNREPGLSDALIGSHSLTDIKQHIDGGNLTVLPSGKIPPNPSELLLRERFKSVIDELSEAYDIVIIDAPPVLAVTDAGVISSALGQTMAFMVLRSGEHPPEEIDEAISRFNRQGGKINGMILNYYSPRAATAVRGYGHYQYKYVSDKK